MILVLIIDGDIPSTYLTKVSNLLAWIRLRLLVEATNAPVLKCVLFCAILIGFRLVLNYIKHLIIKFISYNFALT